MGDFTKRIGGELSDDVELVLDGKEVLIAEEYEVSIRFLQVPCAFSITVGSGETAADIMGRYPAHTPFQLRIGGVTQFAGRTDGYARSSASATEIQLSGRDVMAFLVDDHILHDKTYTNCTFEELVRDQLLLAGITGYALTFDTASQRKAVAGTPIVEEETVEVDINPNDLRVLAIEPAPGQDLRFTPLDYNPKYEKTVQRITGYRADKPIQAKAGMTRYSFLEKELKRGGLFLRAGVDPEGEDEFVFVMGEPSGMQPALYQFINARGATSGANAVNVMQPRIRNTLTTRHSEYHVLGRAGGGADGRTQIHGIFIDDDVKEHGKLAKFVKADPDVKSQAQADYIARRTAAEARRSNRNIVYPIPHAHTLPLLKDPQRRAVISIDTVAHIRDDEHGIDGDFWIEGVSHKCGSRTGKSSDATLIRPEDLVFGDGEFYLNAGKKKKKGRKGTF
jgi:prophage tail gpP-like protein